MPKNKVSEKYLENLKIFRGPTHNIAHLPQFAPKSSSKNPLTDIDFYESFKNLKKEDITNI